MKKDDILGFKGIFCFLIWFLLTNYSTFPFELLHIDINALPTIFKQLYTIVIELGVILLCLVMFKPQIDKMFKDYKKNSIEYFKKYFKYWFLILGLMLASNAIILIFNPGSTANNQDLVNQMYNLYPVYTFILSVILAPVIEELIFRLCFYNIFNNKYVFIILSGLVFGAFHIIGTYETALDWLYIIPYSIPGFIFAGLLYKTKNIYLTIFLHFVHNGLISSINILLMLI